MATAEIPQHIAALESATTARLERAAVKRDLLTGRLSLEAALTDPPGALQDALLIEVVRWTLLDTRGKRVTRLGAEALDAGVNLMLPVRCASPFVRAWVVEHGIRNQRSRA